MTRPRVSRDVALLGAALAAAIIGGAALLAPVSEEQPGITSGEALESDAAPERVFSPPDREARQVHAPDAPRQKILKFLRGFRCSFSRLVDHFQRKYPACRPKTHIFVARFQQLRSKQHA